MMPALQNTQDENRETRTARTHARTHTHTHTHRERERERDTDTQADQSSAYLYRKENRACPYGWPCPAVRVWVSQCGGLALTAGFERAADTFSARRGGHTSGGLGEGRTAGRADDGSARACVVLLTRCELSGGTEGHGTGQRDPLLGASEPPPSDGGKTCFWWVRVGCSQVLLLPLGIPPTPVPALCHI